MTTIPTAIVRAHVAMLPRLTAEESLAGAQRMAVGTGALTKSDAMEIVDRWLRQADVPAQTWQEQVEIVRAITVAMGGTVPPRPPKDAS